MHLGLAWPTVVMEVQSSTDTFQKLFHEISSKLMYTHQTDAFSCGFRTCKTDEERVRFVLELDLITEILNSRTYHRPTLKCATRSEKLRVEGNYLFKKKKFLIALEKYTESVLSAPCQGDSTHKLSMALANRSATLFHMKDFKGCLEDIKLALLHGYPDKLKYKLLERSGRCYHNIRDNQHAKKMFNEMNNYLSVSDLPAEKQNQITAECDKLLENVPADVVGTSPTYCTKTPTLEESDQNTMYPCALSSFSIQYDALQGRYAAAMRDIKAGELILIERPFSAVLAFKSRLTHCHHCLKRSNTLIGCLVCSSVGFCSLECRESAFLKYHGVECNFIDLLYQADTGLGHLSLRMIITAGYEYLLKCKQTNIYVNNGNVNISNGLNKDGVYDSLSYLSIDSLVGHSDDRSLSDLFRRTVLATYLLRFINNDPFFINDANGLTKDEKQVCIGAQILKQLQMLPCNAHEVSELQINKSNIALSELKEIGSAIYATLSLLNHSCDPSVVRHSYGNICALRAIKNIPRGGEIIDNYGALYPVSSYKDRQKLLTNQYYFTCCCKACNENWPLYANIHDGSPVFVCLECKDPVQSINNSETDFMFCNSCAFELPFTKSSFETSQKHYLLAMQNVLDGQDPEENLPPLVNHLRLMSNYVRLPWQEFNNCQEIVKQCFSMLGNHYSV